MNRREDAVLLGTFIVCLVMMAWSPISDPDVGFHLALGRQIVSQRSLPTTETLSFARPGAPIGGNPWLGSVLVYLVFRLGGATALITAKCAIVVAMFLLLLATCRTLRPGDGEARQQPLALAVLLLAVGAWAARMRFGERPLLLTALLEAFLLWRLSQLPDRPSLRSFWWLPPFFLFWWNLHAGYLYGLLIIAAFVGGDLLDRTRRPAAIRLSAATAVSLLTAVLLTYAFHPESLRGLAFPLRMFQSRVFSRVIEELHRPSLHKYPAFTLLLVVTPLCFALSWIRGTRPRTTHLLLYAVFAGLALSRIRMILDFALVAAPLAGAYAPRIPPRIPSRWATLAAAAVLAVVVPWRVLGAEPRRFGGGFDPQTYPLPAFDFLQREQVAAEVMVNDLWSGPFLWRMHPQRRVFVHNQFETYQEALWRDEYLPLLGAAPGWRETLDRYAINALVLRYTGGGFLQEIPSAVFADHGWTLVYWDDVAMIYVRNIPRHASLIARDGLRLLNPDRPQLEALARQGLGAEVERELLSVLARTPDCRRGWSLLGELRLGQGNSLGAAEAFRSLLRVSRGKGEKAAALGGCGLALLQRGDARGARDSFDQALRLRPGDSFVLSRRALASLAAGDRHAAAEDAGRLMKSPNARPEDLQLLAESLAAAGDARTARELSDRRAALARGR